MDPELEFNEDYDRIPDLVERTDVHEEFQSIITWHFATGQLLDDGIFDCNGSKLLIRGEY